MSRLMELPLRQASPSLPAAATSYVNTKPVRLRFLLGEIPLFTVALPLVVHKTHFTKLPNTTDVLSFSSTDLPSAAQGVLIRSHVVQQDLPRLSLFPDSIRYVPAQYQRYYIELRSSFADYLSKFSSKSRGTLHRKIRRFTAFSNGHVDWRAYRALEEMREFYPLARKVSELTYQERLLHTGLPNDDGFRAEIFDQASHDRARGYLLFHNGQPIAYLLCVVEGTEILLYRYLGYDPQYQSWSPGTVLQYFVLEKLFAEGEIRIFDFTEGEGAQKRFLSTGSVRCADIYFFRRRPAILMTVVLHCVLQTVSQVLVNALDRLGLKSRVKNFLRSQSARRRTYKKTATAYLLL